MDLNSPIGIWSVQLMVQAAEEYGVGLTAALEGSGITVETLYDPVAELTVRQEFAVLRNLQQYCGSQPGFWVRLGTRYHLGMHGNWGLMMVSGRTLRESLAMALPFSDLAWAFTTLGFHEADGLAAVEIDGGDIPADIRRPLVERTSGAARVFHRELLGVDLPIAAVRYRHAAPASIAPYIEVFGVEPVFGAEDNSMWFDAAHLDLPLPQGNEWVRRGYEQICRDLLTKRRARTGIAGAVREVLIRRPREIPDAVDVARALKLSPRTLFRRLDDEGTTFRALVDEVREMLALELLRDSDLTVAKVAREVGYSDPGSFVRAFKRWRGQTPQEFRTTARARPGQRLRG